MTTSSDTPAMTDPTELIARLEEAKEGNWILSCEVCAAAYGLSEEDTAKAIANRTASLERLSLGGLELPVGFYENLRPFTTSIDAALTLVPDGWGVNFHTSPPHHNCCQSAWLTRGTAPYFDGEEIEASAATAIIALCIVSLKARTKTKEVEG